MRQVPVHTLCRASRNAVFIWAPSRFPLGFSAHPRSLYAFGHALTTGPYGCSQRLSLSRLMLAKISTSVANTGSTPILRRPTWRISSVQAGTYARERSRPPWMSFVVVLKICVKCWQGARFTHVGVDEPMHVHPDDPNLGSLVWTGGVRVVAKRPTRGRCVHGST